MHRSAFVFNIVLVVFSCRAVDVTLCVCLDCSRAREGSTETGGRESTNICFSQQGENRGQA